MHNIKLKEYIKGSEQQFYKFPELKEIWDDKELQVEADKSFDRYDERGTGALFMIMDNEDIIGITGYYLTDDKSMCGLRWHGVTPRYRGKGISTLAIKLVLKHIKEKEKQLRFMQELVPFNYTKIMSYFNKIGFKLVNSEAIFHENMPTIKSYKVLLDLNTL